MRAEMQGMQGAAHDMSARMGGPMGGPPPQQQMHMAPQHGFGQYQPPQQMVCAFPLPLPSLCFVHSVLVFKFFSPWVCSS